MLFRGTEVRCTSSARAMERLSHLEQDALEEVLRLHVRRSSSALDDVPGWASGVRFERYCPDAGPSHAGETGHLWVVRQSIVGDVQGESSWSIREHDGLRLVRRHRRMSVDASELTPLEREAVTEVGNIMIDGLLEGFAVTLGLYLGTSAPTFRSSPWCGPGAPVAIELSHAVDGESIASYLQFSWTAATAERFRQALALYVGPFLSQLSWQGG